MAKVKNQKVVSVFLPFVGATTDIDVPLNIPFACTHLNLKTIGYCNLSMKSSDVFTLLYSSLTGNEPMYCFPIQAITDNTGASGVVTGYQGWSTQNPDVTFALLPGSGNIKGSFNFRISKDGNGQITDLVNNAKYIMLILEFIEYE